MVRPWSHRPGLGQGSIWAQKEIRSRYPPYSRAGDTVAPGDTVELLAQQRQMAVPCLPESLWPQKREDGTSPCEQRSHKRRSSLEPREPTGARPGQPLTGSSPHGHRP